MIALDDPLWHRLRRLRFEPAGAALTFTRRLAREQGWSAAFSARVVEEYRRFLYLCAVAGAPVTPSDAVDQAWHLHLTYTRAYWQDLCDGVLGRPLHHDPTAGGPTQRLTFHRGYADTLAAYTERFGAPPVDIWPDPEARFAPRGFRRVAAAEHWIVSKRSARRVAAAGAALPLPLALAGCNPLATAGAIWRDLETVPGWFWVVFGLVALLVLVQGRRGRRERGG